MGSFDALDKAKKAAEGASQTAKDAMEQAALKAAGIRDLTLSKAHEASDLAAGVRDQAAAKVGGWKEALEEKVTGMKTAALDGVKQIADDLNSYLPALGEAGYTLREVQIEVGIDPKLVATFDARPGITEESIEAVIAAHADAKILGVMLRTLYRAYKAQNSIQIAGMKAEGISLALGLLPYVAVKFR